MADQSEPGRLPSTRVCVRAAEGTLLTRLTSVLGQHHVDHFSYDAGPGRDVTATIGVVGDSWQVRRVAARIHRVVGVLAVTVERAGSPSGP